jgi:hypothetical protein
MLPAALAWYKQALCALGKNCGVDGASERRLDVSGT